MVEKHNVAKGIQTWMTNSGIAVVRLHYTADPDRCDEEWLQHQLLGYEGGMEGNDWKREMEIDFSSYAGSPIYPRFSDRSIAPTLFNPEIPLWRGWDFGYRHPAVVWAQLWPDDTLCVLNEYYPTLDSQLVPGMTTTELGQNVIDITQKLFPEAKEDMIFDYCDPAGNQKKETSEFSSIEQLSQLGIYAIWSKIGRVYRINAARRYVENPEKFRVDPNTCPLFIEALKGAYHYPEEDDKTAPSQPEMPDVSGQAQREPYIHLMDAFEYIVAVELCTEYADQTPKTKENELSEEMQEQLRQVQVKNLVYQDRLHIEDLESMLKEESVNINEALELDW